MVKRRRQHCVRQHTTAENATRSQLSDLAAPDDLVHCIASNTDIQHTVTTHLITYSPHMLSTKTMTGCLNFKVCDAAVFF